MAVRPLNYGKGFPVTPYGLVWASRDLAGLGARAGSRSRRPRKLRRLVNRGNSLRSAPSLRVLKRQVPVGRFGMPTIKRYLKDYGNWEKYQGLSGHPTLSSTNPRYAAWRGRMYGGLAGVESILSPLLSTGANVFGSVLQAKAASKAASSSSSSNAALKKAAAMQVQAAEIEAASKEKTTRTLLIAGGLVAAGLVAFAVLRRK